MATIVRRWCVPLGAVLLLARAGVAAELATLEGKVADLGKKGAGIAAVRVEVRSGGSTLATALTGDDGTYVIPGLVAGLTVDIVYERSGYKDNPTKRDNVRLTSPRTPMPAIPMVQATGTAEYYKIVAEEIGSRYSGSAKTQRELRELVDSLEPEEKSTVERYLHEFAAGRAALGADPSVDKVDKGLVDRMKEDAVSLPPP